MSTNFDKFAQITNWMMLLEKKNSRILLDIYPEETKTLIWKDTHPNVHSSAFYSSQDMEAT